MRGLENHTNKDRFVQVMKKLPESDFDFSSEGLGKSWKSNMLSENRKAKRQEI